MILQSGRGENVLAILVYELNKMLNKHLGMSLIERRNFDNFIRRIFMILQSGIGVVYELDGHINIFNKYNKK